MATRKGRTIIFDKTINIRSSAAAVGVKEGKGPLAADFDHIAADDMMGESTWEKAETRLQKTALEKALSKASLSVSMLDMILAGDLLAQCIASAFSARDTGVPFFGQYGACSTMAQALITGALLCESGAFTRVAAVTSSHFCSAERQFRMPLEYGGQRTLTAQWTVTGAGAVILEENSSEIRIADALPGVVTDMKVTDTANMGAAMAPAAADTILSYFRDTDTSPSDYDLILTGDLGNVGSELLLELLMREGTDISSVHKDCGRLIFDQSEQDVHSGGSGCGCCASVLSSRIVNMLYTGKLSNILFIATGALMSPVSSAQGESIPGIAHLVHIVSEKGWKG